MNRSRVRLFELRASRTRQLATRLSEGWRPRRLVFSPDGHNLLARLSHESIGFVVNSWDVESGAESYRVGAGVSAFPTGVTWFATDHGPAVRRLHYATGGDVGNAVLTPQDEQWY